MATSLTFDQQKEFLMLQLDHDKFELKAELAVEKICQQTEQAERDRPRLVLINEG